MQKQVRKASAHLYEQGSEQTQEVLWVSLLSYPSLLVFTEIAPNL